jgi:ABC-type multidrug transport system permease subunit
MSFDFDAKWIPILKDADIQLAVWVSSIVLWIAADFCGVVPIESWLLWVKVVFIVSSCFVLVSVIASFFRHRA